MGKVIGFCHKQLYITDSQGKWIEDGDLDNLDEEEKEKRRKMRLMFEAKSLIGLKPLPVVRFKVPGGSRDMLVEADVFKAELPNGEVQASRSQVSLFSFSTLIPC